ncbi:MAG: DUF554 domain-containing protein [Firmicutes bacterium]|nr:DUF554 domain-containing protein [Bacillota bacterium]
MVLWGSFVNAMAIVGGALLGRAVKFPDQVQQTITNGLGLAIAIIGISMGLETNNILIPVIALVLGAVIGETLKIEGRIAQVGTALQRRFQQKTDAAPGFTQGFLTASVIFCVGAMAVIGGLNSGLRGDHQVLYAKSMLDGTLTVFLSASFGLGAGFSALPVFLYQGSIALLAALVAPILSQPVLEELTATGGILILGIALNMLKLTKIALGNLLPAIALSVLIAWFFF